MEPSEERSGLLAAGNFIVDHVKIIDAYPREEMLASIISERLSNGGGPYNILTCLAAMKVPFPLAAAGLTGADADGRWILDDCRRNGIDTTRLRSVDGVSTSYTDAFTVRSTGRRTFFHQRGANARLTAADFDFTGVTARLFYLGYLMLLDGLDAIGADGRTGASRVLEQAGEAGMVTIADMVSVESPDFAASAAQSLPYIDHFVLNEIEAGMLAGEPMRDAGGRLLPQAVEEGIGRLLAMGVRRSVTIHFVEGGICGTKDGRIHRRPSLKLPPEFIAGATGAGDAFAAGMICGWHMNLPPDECLRLAGCTAAACLSDPTPSGGLRPLEECYALEGTFGLRDWPAA